MLVGDALTTAPGSKGLRKKVYLISPNLVVGWTGSLIVARQIIPDLFRRFYETEVRKWELDGFLTSYDVAQFASYDVRLVGWVIDGTPHCFTWHSGYPGQVFVNDSYVFGTGERYFQEITDPARAVVSGGSTGEQPDDPPKDFIAIYEALVHTGQAFFEELLFPEQWNPTFGFAYEILAYNEGRFKAVHTVSHIGWDYHWDSDSKTGTGRLAPFLARFIHNGNCSIIQRAIHNDLKVKSYKNYIVRPVYDNDIDPSLANSEFSIIADFYVHYILLRPYQKHPFRLCFVTSTGVNRQPLWVETSGGQPSIEIDTKFIDQIFIEAGA